MIHIEISFLRAGCILEYCAFVRNHFLSYHALDGVLEGTHCGWSKTAILSAKANVNATTSFYESNPSMVIVTETAILTLIDGSFRFCMMANRNWTVIAIVSLKVSVNVKFPVDACVGSVGEETACVQSGHQHHVRFVASDGFALGHLFGETRTAMNMYSLNSLNSSSNLASASIWLNGVVSAVSRLYQMTVSILFRALPTPVEILELWLGPHVMALLPCFFKQV